MKEICSWVRNVRYEATETLESRTISESRENKRARLQSMTWIQERPVARREALPELQAVLWPLSLFVHLVASAFVHLDPSLATWFWELNLYLYKVKDYKVLRLF